MNLMTRRRFMCATLGLAGAAVLPAASGAQVRVGAGSRRVFQSARGLAIGGFDPVAYFMQQRPVHGLTAYRTEWNGAVWQFATPAHRTVFESNPSAFAPRYGGYCALAVAREGALFASDPDHWAIFAGGLYLNFNPETRAQWVAECRDLIPSGDANWAALRTRLN